MRRSIAVLISLVLFLAVAVLNTASQGEVVTASTSVQPLEMADLPALLDDAIEERRIEEERLRIEEEQEAERQRIAHEVEVARLQVKVQQEREEREAREAEAHRLWHEEQDRKAREVAAAQTARREQSARASRSAAPGGGDIAARIRNCESGNRNVKNPSSSASGYYQFIDSTWRSVTGLAPPAMAYSFEQQHAAFLKLWAGGAGASNWNPSRHCWG